MIHRGGVISWVGESDLGWRTEQISGHGSLGFNKSRDSLCAAIPISE